MDFSSVSKLCHHLISSAIQRCRFSQQLCRLSILLKCSPDSSVPQSLRVSISDTGAGSCLDEFKDLKFSIGCISDEKWDGLVSVTTTGISDDDIYNYQLNIMETSATRRLRKLPSNPKSGAKFSGTEVSLSTSDKFEDLLADLTQYLHKMRILKISNVATELTVEYGGASESRRENVIMANDCDPLNTVASNIERLKLGLEEYVTKHGNSLEKKCPCCFQSWEFLKVGSGTACTAESNRSTGYVMEAIIIISESSEPSGPCIRAFGPKTEVLFFKDFSPNLITHSSLKALDNIDWRSYGLSLQGVTEQDGCALLEWEHFPPCAHIDIVLHCYTRQCVAKVKIPPLRQKAQLERNLVKKAVKNALDDLKEKYAGILLSARALKIRSYAPDLARTVADLILSSNDSNFQGECYSLLGLQSQDIEGETVAECIKDKIIKVIETDDRNPLRGNAPFLFESDCFSEPYFQDDEYEGEESFNSLDL